MQSTLIEALNGPRTQNGALTLSTSNSSVVDFFFLLGALRGASETEITTAFTHALNEDINVATKLLFYTRDRNGQGERRVFRILVNFLANSNVLHQLLVKNNIQNIPHYGRWDDLFALIDTPLENEALARYADALRAGSSLAAKWAPREKSSNRKVALKLMKTLGYTPKQYRKLLSGLTDVVETNMCSNNWDEINYSQVPSLAMSNYRKAFEKHSKERWDEYVDMLVSGKTKVNASVLYPYQIVRAILDGNYAYETPDQRSTQANFLAKQWESLPNYIAGNKENMLPVVDVSGSMTQGHSKTGPAPLDIAISLGLYISERNKGIFHDTFMTFSDEPELVTLTSSDIVSRVMEMKRASWGMSTNLTETFRVLLNTAMSNHIAPDQMPTMLLIISDMEFNAATSSSGWASEETTNFNTIKMYYKAAGYNLPKIVFWNINGRSQNIPVEQSTNNTSLVSGFSPVIMKHILASGSVTPYQLVMDVVNSDRYSQVVV